MQIKTSIIFDTKPKIVKLLHSPILTKVRKAGCFLSHWQKGNKYFGGGGGTRQNCTQSFHLKTLSWKFSHKCAKIVAKMHIVGLSPKKVLRDYPSAYRFETEIRPGIATTIMWFVKLGKIWVIAAWENMYVYLLKDSTMAPQMIDGSFEPPELDP